MQSEYDALGQELYNIMNNTTFGGSKLLAGGAGHRRGDLPDRRQRLETMSVDVSTSMTTLGTDLLAATANYAAGSTGTELTASANATITKLETALKEWARCARPWARPPTAWTTSTTTSAT
jgi:flagellin